LLRAVTANEAEDVEKMREGLLEARFGNSTKPTPRQAPAQELSGPPDILPNLGAGGSNAQAANVATMIAQDRTHTSQAQRIRHFVLKHHIEPARNAGRDEVRIRAGDVHRQMRLTNGMPAVCSALGSRKFLELADVALVDREGPANGSNVYFRFTLRSRSTSATIHRKPITPLPERQSSSEAVDLDLTDAIALVSCVKRKLPHAAQARDLYTSAFFRKARDLVEASGAPWFVLSAKYGLIRPDQVIEPYDFTLNTAGTAERRAWATSVLAELLSAIGNRKRVVFLAGERYREFLIEPLRQRGFTIEVPMDHLTRGEQLAWLSEHE